jgi:hypothetical protein
LRRPDDRAGSALRLDERDLRAGAVAVGIVVVGRLIGADAKGWIRIV